MLHQLKLFLTALQFFTRIPVPAWVGHTARQLDQSARYFTLVGVCVGLLAGGILWAGSAVLPLQLAVGLSMLSGILMTGAFHEDGLSDFVDGIGGGYTRDKILDIMKDSRVGAYGVIAVTIALLIKFQALLAIGSTRSIVLAAASLVAAHAISRWMALSIMLTQSYVRDEDSARAKPVAQTMSRSSFVIASLISVAAIGILPAAGAAITSVLSAVACAVLLRTYLAWLMKKKLGGYTGDCLGAVQQITEIGFYLGLLAAIQP